MRDDRVWIRFVTRFYSVCRKRISKRTSQFVLNLHDELNIYSNARRRP